MDTVLPIFGKDHVYMHMYMQQTTLSVKYFPDSCNFENLVCMYSHGRYADPDRPYSIYKI